MPTDGEGEVVIVVLEPAMPGPAARRWTEEGGRIQTPMPPTSPALRQHLRGRHLEAGAEEWEAPPVRAGERASRTKGRRGSVGRPPWPPPRGHRGGVGVWSASRILASPPPP
jgi:hypothetical protein